VTGLSAPERRDERAPGIRGRGAHGGGGRLARARDRRAKRRAASAALSGIGVPRSRLTSRDAVREAVIAVARAPMRTVLTSMGTVLAVGTAIATIGLSDSAAGAVTKTFNALRATVVTFSNNRQYLSPPDLTEAAEPKLDRLNGVVDAGLIWSLGTGGQLYQVSRTAPTVQSGQPSIGLSRRPRRARSR
jgi:hypothetical protein